MPLIDSEGYSIEQDTYGNLNSRVWDDDFDSGNDFDELPVPERPGRDPRPLTQTLKPKKKRK